MNEYLIWVQHEEEWKEFGTFCAKDGRDAIRHAREKKIELQLMFCDVDISHVNMDYELL